MKMMKFNINIELAMAWKTKEYILFIMLQSYFTDKNDMIGGLESRTDIPFPD
jgi:hypothetical protein